jgi:hypothetical protein
MKKNKINDGHYLELMDRIHVQLCMIDDHLLNHVLTKKLKKVHKLVDNAHWNLLESYQIVGHESYSRKENEKQKVVLRRRKKSEK